MQLFKKKVLIQFCIIFVPVTLAIIGIFGAIQYWQASEELDQLKVEETRLVKLYGNTIKYALETINSDILTLSAHAQLHSFLNNSSKQDLQPLAEEFLAFCQSRGMYDQVRLLDEQGMEKIRVSYNRGKSVVVPNSKLQFKGKRYYFTNSIRLNRGEIFISPFDLNVEQGKIEQPLKPVIRVAMPLFDNAGNKKGILILNYLGNNLFDRIDNLTASMGSRVTMLLLNQQGYWLKGLNQEAEWGFMFKDDSRTFGHHFPNIWGKIAGEKSGYILNGKGLFTFDTIYPLTERIISSSGSTKADEESAYQLDWKSYFWKLVTYVPATKLTLNTSKNLSNLIPFVVLIISLLGIISFVAASAIVRREETQENIKHLAHFDILTQLPNRALLYDRLTQVIAQDERYNKSFALLFIDLDGFKSVNDIYGHKAGDDVLKEAANRIRSHIRKMDTVARIGGDEFLVVLTDVQSPSDARLVAEKTVSSLGQPFLIAGEQQNVIGGSIGISIYPTDGLEMDVLIKRADEAMYEVKKSGKSSYRFYSG